MWITDLIKTNNHLYKTNKEALEETIKIIRRWGKHSNVNIYMYHNTCSVNRKRCNRIISILTPSNKGYEYKLTIHRLNDGYIPSLKRLHSSGFSYGKKEYIYISFKFYEDDPI